MRIQSILTTPCSTEVNSSAADLSCTEASPDVVAGIYNHHGSPRVDLIRCLQTCRSSTNDQHIDIGHDLRTARTEECVVLWCRPQGGGVVVLSHSLSFETLLHTELHLLQQILLMIMGCARPSYTTVVAVVFSFYCGPAGRSPFISHPPVMPNN